MASPGFSWSSAPAPERSNSQQSTAAFDSLAHARLDPSAFDPASFDSSFFVPPRIFNSPGGNLGFGAYDLPYGNVAIAEPRLDYAQRGAHQQDHGDFNALKSYGFGTNDFASASGNGSASPASMTLYPSAAPPSSFSFEPQAAQRQPQAQAYTQPQQPPPPPPPPASRQRQASTSANSYPPSTSTATNTVAAPYTPNGPVYAPYGSSLINLPGPADQSLLKLPPAQTPAPPPFSPTALGLPPYPPPGTSTNFAGLYSASGFDMVSVLARVASRPNPSLQIGPVDTSCSFLVVDARKWDLPIVFCSETFTRLTGYTSSEISTAFFASSKDNLSDADVVSLQSARIVCSLVKKH